MKRFLLLMTALVTFNAQAALMTLSLDKIEAAVGEQVIATVGIALEDGELFSDFQFDLNFDNSIFRLTSDLISPEFGGLGFAHANDLGLSALGNKFDGALSGNVTLFDFTLEVLDASATSLGLANVFAFDSFNMADVNLSAQSAVSFNQVSVPAPATLGLFLLAGLGLVARRR